MFGQVGQVGFVRDISVFTGEIGAPPRGSGRFYGGFGKRLFDVAFVLTILPILLPLIAGIALLVRRDGGSAFYAQPRIGRQGRGFRCFKIRTMVEDGDALLARYLDAHPEQREIWEQTQKLADDPRVTRFGRFLRASSLDELPQFFNVLRGDMSVVGPRPFLPDQEARYRAAGGAAYFGLRPGVTGPWQIGAHNRCSFEARVDYDEAYLADSSLFADLRIVLATIMVVLRGSGILRAITP